MIRILRSNAQIREARAALKARGADHSRPGRLWLWRLLYGVRYRRLLPAADVTKSWDVHNALTLIERLQPERRTPILDLGCFNSEILYVLHALRYRRLAGCDLNPMCRWMPYWHRIRYEWCDLTHTPFLDSAFGAITCVSVVEHGVDVDALAAEANRLLRPAGLFFLTTDYDADGAAAAAGGAEQHFGQAWTVFDRPGVERMVETFERRGLRLLHPQERDLSHSERPIFWGGRRYTFLLAAFLKQGPS